MAMRPAGGQIEHDSSFTISYAWKERKQDFAAAQQYSAKQGCRWGVIFKHALKDKNTGTAFFQTIPVLQGWAI